MNKTLKTLLSVVMTAAALIASSAALADAANVEIYGTLNTDFENVRATGSTAKGTTVPGCPLNTCQMVNGVNTNSTSVPIITTTTTSTTGAVSVTTNAAAVNTNTSGSATIGQPSGNVAPSRNRVTSNSSNIGFRGSEDLGMGLKAIFQIESGISIDSASTTTTTAGTASTGFFGSRNTNVGLSSSKLGTAFYGNWDTPYKSLTNTSTFSSFYGTGIADVNTMIGTPGFGVQSITTSQRNGNASDASFDRRQGNSVQYWTPQFYGISARLVYSADEQRSIEPESASGTTTNPNINPLIYGASIAYEYGPFRAAYAFEQHKDYFGLTQLGGQVPLSVTNNTSRDNANKATLGYKLDTSAGTTQLNVAFEQLAYNNSDRTAGDLIHYHRNLVYFAGQHKMGASTFRTGFGNAWSGSCYRAGGATPAACSTTGLDARQYAIGYSYSFSKRTDVYAFFTLVNNGEFANYELGNNAPITGNITSGLGPGVGAHQQGFGLGMRHVF